ncbi:sugar transferase [Rossellomorea marisflavi]|uniref:sugar transferase n=1 Tax=Rossellomorea marisflavi TaxID=189381 RepID=UPI00207AECED|nr:sugar transferase [Rossellomorea marisflavi]USK91805.1 sugar transferase [Rossellomorea marisflavi]
MRSQTLSTQKDFIIDKSLTFIIIKRVIDIVGSLIGLIIFTPLFILISIVYMFEEKKGPIFFNQARIGMKGKIFRIYKFRSMVVDAENKLKSNHQLYEKYLKNNYKLEPEEDPRVTKIGAFLRKTSLDELPQLINVLKGDMSLVGPRPVLHDELIEYEDKLNHFLSVKPGVTGYWQVSGRSDVGYPERVELELYYVYNQSLRFDVRILLKTISIVLLKKGAY